MTYEEAADIIRKAGRGTETFYDRLVKERDDLDHKLDALNGFILTPAFAVLDHEQRRLLQRQALQMGDYLDTLGARLKLLDDDGALDLTEAMELREEGRTEIRETGKDRSEEPMPFTDDRPAVDRRLPPDNSFAGSDIPL